MKTGCNIYQVGDSAAFSVVADIAITDRGGNAVAFTSPAVSVLGFDDVPFDAAAPTVSVNGAQVTACWDVDAAAALLADVDDQVFRWALSVDVGDDTLALVGGDLKVIPLLASTAPYGYPPINAGDLGFDALYGQLRHFGWPPARIFDTPPSFSGYDSDSGFQWSATVHCDCSESLPAHQPACVLAG